MKAVYDAADSLDAHIVAGLLESHGLDCRIEGDYLPGGMGELPVSGLVRVLVEEDDVEAARAVISEREAAVRTSTRKPGKEAGQPVALWLLAAAALALSLWAILRSGG